MPDPTRALGVLAGKDMPDLQLRAWATSAEVVLAADAGADLLRALGIEPHEVIGDFDSVTSNHAGATLIHEKGQEDTDCDKLLRRAAARGLESITLVGVEGDQLDHMLATLQSAAKAAIEVRLGLRTGVGWVLTGEATHTIATQPGRRISLIPLTPSEGVTLRGVQWPLERHRLDPLGPTSISNVATGHEVFVHLWEGAAFLFVEFRPDEMPFWTP